MSTFGISAYTDLSPHKAASRDRPPVAFDGQLSPSPTRHSLASCPPNDFRAGRSYLNGKPPLWFVSKATVCAAHHALLQCRSCPVLCALLSCQRRSSHSPSSNIVGLVQAATAEHLQHLRSAKSPDFHYNSPLDKDSIKSSIVSTRSTLDDRFDESIARLRAERFSLG